MLGLLLGISKTEVIPPATAAKLTVLRFSFLQNDVYLGNFSVFFTVLSILLFSNAMNMFDGSNCQALTYFILISLLFVIINPDFKFLLFLLPVYTILYFLNFSNKLFLNFDIKSKVISMF